MTFNPLLRTMRVFLAPDDGTSGPGGGSTTPITTVVDPAVIQGNPGAVPNSVDKQAAGWQKLYTEKDLQYKTLLAQNEALTATVQMHKTTADEKALALAQREAELTAQRERAERADVILSEFPQLIPFYKSGVLPSGSGDVLRASLQKFSETLTQFTGAQQTPPPAAGAAVVPPPQTPPTPGDKPQLGGKEDPKVVFARARQALADGDNAKYSAEMKVYYSLTK